MCSSKAPDAWGGRRRSRPPFIHSGRAELSGDSRTPARGGFVVGWVRVFHFPSIRSCHLDIWGREHASLVFRQSRCSAIPDG